jgi:ATP-dependent protease HslVU (ClpYQ) peptidase subunit
MTCIVGVIEGDKVWMGGDSAAFCGTALTIRATPKVFKNGAFLIGCCGSPRVRDVLRYHFEPPKHPRGMDIGRYMRVPFIDAMREALKKAGVLRKTHEVEEASDSAVLVAYRGRIFTIEEDFQVGEPLDGFAAVGCGSDVAVGALVVSENVAPRKRILAALGASERYNTGVRRPFYVQVIE